jgi:hypothetical protein
MAWRVSLLISRLEFFAHNKLCNRQWSFSSHAPIRGPGENMGIVMVGGKIRSERRLSCRSIGVRTLLCRQKP